MRLAEHCPVLPFALPAKLLSTRRCATRPPCLLPPSKPIRHVDAAPEVRQ